MLELMDINDDCLEHIFRLCDVKEQLALKKVCWRFDCIFERNWRTGHKILSYNHDRYKSVMYDKKLLREVVPLIHDYVEEIFYNTVEQFRCLSSRVWPKVRYVTGFVIQEHFSYDNTVIRTRNSNFCLIFPALERWQMTWTLEIGDYGNNLFFGPCLPPFGESFPANMCQSYEYTSLTLHMILKNSSRGLHTLSFNYVSHWHKELERLSLLRDLRRLNFCGMPDCSQGMVTLLDELPHLREVHYRSERSESKDCDLTQARHFISLCVAALKLRPSMRTNPLHLYCYAERKNCDILKEEFSDSEKLRLFYVDSCLNGGTWPFHYKISFQCEWDKKENRKRTHSLNK